MFSNAADLARFTIAFMNDGIIEGRSVLERSTIVALSTGYVDVPSSSSAEPGRYGYGLTTSTHRGVGIVEQGGSIDGFGASARMLPDHKAAVVVLVNRSGASLPKTSERALEIPAPLQPALAELTTPSAWTPLRWRSTPGATSTLRRGSTSSLGTASYTSSVASRMSK
jgi:CubicO group peptidase (beta-lactamase class C family)